MSSTTTVNGVNHANIPPLKELTHHRTLKQLFRDLLVLSRYHQPDGLLAALPGVWSILLAGALRIRSDNGYDASLGSLIFRQAIIGFFATFILCGAGVVWNDWVDRDIDAAVARTKDRPLASGRLTTTDAMAWIMAQVLTSWYLYHIMLDGNNVSKAMIPELLAGALYPFGKRPIAHKLRIYPQYILGVSIAYPAITGWAAIHGIEQSFTETIHHCLPLCIFVFCWVFYSNTAYSYQDVVDDSELDVNSSYVLAGSYIHLFLVALGVLVLGTIPFVLYPMDSLWLWVSWMGVWSVSYIGQLSRFDASQPSTGGAIIKSDFFLGLWTTVICIAEVFLRAYSN